MKKLVLVCLAAMMAVSLAACSESPSEASQPESSTVESATESSATESSDTEEVSDEPSEEESTELAVGDTASLQDWEISLTAWETTSEIQDSTGFISFTPTEGNQFIVISTTVTNNGTASGTFLPSFALSDDVKAKIYFNGEYEYSSTQLLGEENDLHNTALNPLTSKSGTIVYDVPPAVTDGTEPLVITFEAGTEPITFKLR